MSLSHRVQHVLLGSNATTQGLAWSPDGSLLATFGGDTELQVWDARTGSLLASLAAPEPRAAGLAFSPDGSRLATALVGGRISLWDSRIGIPLPVYSDPIFRTS